MPRFRRSVVLVASALLLAGCASAGRSSAQQSGASGVRRNPDIITEEELAGIHEGDLYAAVQRLRPNFLIAHGPTSLLGNGPGIVVYLDNTRLGDVTALRQIPAQDVKQVQFLSASEATQRFGTGTPNGAILVTHR